MLGLCAEELTAVWAVLAAILHLGNICFSSSEVGSPCRQDHGAHRIGSDGFAPSGQ